MNYNKSFEKFIKSCKYLKEMEHFVATTKDICPERRNVFRFLDLNLNSVKCIVLGMDPYPSTYERNGRVYPVATGRAFEVSNITYWTDKHKQVSLSNIFKSLIYLKFGKSLDMETIRKNVNEKNFRYLKIIDWFDAMEKEGVMFLNATLTTCIGKSGVHENIWKDFMNELFTFIVSETHDIKWFIWGEAARNRVSGIVDKKNIFYTCHPATRVNNTFVEDCPFSKVNNINWV